MMRTIVEEAEPTMQLAYRRSRESLQDAGAAPPLVLLHAFPVDSRMWREQLASLQGPADVLALDLRGYGRSEAGEEPFTLELLADDVLETLSSLFPAGVRAVFGGCSMGGYLAFEIWRRRPEAVAGLVLCDTRAEADTEEIRARRRDQVEKIRAEGAEFLPRLMLPNVLGAATRETRPELADEIRGWMSAPAPQVLIWTLEMLAARPDSGPTLATITVPTLVMVGEEDTITPRSCAEQIRDGIPGAELAVIPQAGHLAPLENPQAANQAIEEWLGRNF